MADALAALQISDGASHQYRLDETSGTAATDRGSVPVNGTYSNGSGSGHFTLNQPAIVPGSTGCVYLDGSQGFVDFNFDATASLSAAFSFEIVWMPNATGATAVRAIANSNPGGANRGICILGDNYNSTQCGISGGFGAAAVIQNAAPFEFANQFGAGRVTMIHGIWRGASSPTLEYWLNGVKIQSLATSGNYVAAILHISVGRDPNGPGNYCNGWFSDFAHYNFALSAAQIAAHYALLGQTFGSPGLLTGFTSSLWKAGGPTLLAATPIVLPVKASLPDSGAPGLNVSQANSSGLGQIFPTGRS